MKTRVHLLALTMIFTFLLASCEKETFVEEPRALQTTTDPEAPEIVIPEITHESALFEELSDSVRNWIASPEEGFGGEDARSLIEGDERAVTLRNGKLSYYRLALDGNTFGGQYPFRRSGCLIFSPTIRPAGGRGVSNDRNIIDFGLFSGQPYLGQKGAVHFMTNSAMCQYGNTGCNNAAAAIDIVNMKYYEKYRALVVQIDGRFFNNAASGTSLLNLLNRFNATSSLTAFPYHITSGYMIIQFSKDFRSIAGSIKFYGSTLYGHYPVEYKASFGGRTTSYCNQ